MEDTKGLNREVMASSSYAKTRGSLARLEPRGCLKVVRRRDAASRGFAEETLPAFCSSEEKNKK